MSSKSENQSLPYSDEESLQAFYGDVGKNQVRMAFAYPMKLAWDNSVTVKTALCHAKVFERFESAFEMIAKFYDKDSIEELRLNQYGGILNVRKIRGKSKRWSNHARGIACDLDPENNKLRSGPAKSSFSSMEYYGLHKAFESVGAINQGRLPSFRRDFQHFEFTRKDDYIFLP